MTPLMNHKPQRSLAISFGSLNIYYVKCGVLFILAHRILS